MGDGGATRRRQHVRPQLSELSSDEPTVSGLFFLAVASVARIGARHHPGARHLGPSAAFVAHLQIEADNERLKYTIASGSIGYTGPNM